MITKATKTANRRRTHGLTRRRLTLTRRNARSRFPYKPTGVQRDTSETTNWQAVNDPEPTHHLPGTTEKIEVLRRRVELRQKLWHDEDAGNIDE